MLKVVWFFLMILIASKGYAQSFPKGDEEQIRVVINGFYEALNKHDAKKTAGYFTEDGDMRTPWNEWGKNRKEVEQILITQFGNMMRNAQFRQTIISIRMIKPNIASVDLESLVTGMETESNKKYAPMHHHVLIELMKRDGKWQIVIARPF